MRRSVIERKTNETRVNVELNLDGSGAYDVKTGVGFLDHMLEQLAKHGMMDLTVRTEGDLHIDAHHTVEDTGWTVGAALKAALGDKRGIRRYGFFYVPMDEALSRVTADFSGRPFLIWNVRFSQPRIGEMDTELFREWFQAFSQSAGVTLHVENLYGFNNHHIIESCFKALAKAVRAAVEFDPRAHGVLPTTKGAL